MALASARHARNSIELLHQARQNQNYICRTLAYFLLLQLIATHLYTVCQAIDLREMNVRYFSKLQKLLTTELHGILTCTDADALAKAESELFTTLRVQFGETTSHPSEERFEIMLAPLVYELYQKTSTVAALQLKDSPSPLDWVKSLATKARDVFLQNRLEYFMCEEGAYESLGVASKVVYGFVRRELGVPMRKGFPGMDEHEIGSGISEIFEAISSGRMDLVWKDAVAARGNKEKVNGVL
jgi:phenylalanine ammonia-lyase